jgi:hypothetical protein
MSTLKKYYIIFRVKSKPPNSREYIGKQITYNPRDKYLGEKDCYGLRLAINNKGRDQFVKTILKVCSSEEEMNEEYDKLITPEVLTRWKYYNKPPLKGYIPTDEIKAKISKTKKTQFEALSPEQRRGRIYHSEAFKRERSRKYKGEGNHNWKGGVSVKKKPEEAES